MVGTRSPEPDDERRTLQVTVDRSNLVGLCVTCHLELLHQRRLRGGGTAQASGWTLGRGGLLTVHGRTRA
ncbi:MAG: hypothetical protein CVU56_00670 [Deltaproteobacteria bacterium HGW-Deltaproteobacteria-14]|nr:MAG: hypothetical protein CVU56_00670 [Deltaproteobacteria bacterium HGW-Deltaproteobacteria-14]